MIHNCGTCATKHALVIIAGKTRVKCGVSGVKEIPENCSSWKGEGDPLADYQCAPSGFVPKKYAIRDARKKRDTSSRGGA